MLLLEDTLGHSLYKTEQELATKLRVSRIVTVPVMENHQVNGKTLMGIIVNLADYNVGADKGGAINMFEDFDIDYNQEKYLIETRISGCLVKPFSAIVLETSAQG
jgi:glutathione peroxidase-family protein